MGMRAKGNREGVSESKGGYGTTAQAGGKAEALA
jgi:hypothetical protein